MTNRDSSIVGQNFIEYQARVRSVGWQNFVGDGQMAGTSGRSLRLEGIRISISDT